MSMSVIDAAVISASPAEVVHALLDEATGVSHWWLPYLRIQQRGNLTYTEEGGVVDITVSPRGRLTSRFGSAHFTARVVEFDENRRLLTEYIDGDFRGTGEWTFVPIADGKTEVRFTWTATPHGVMKVVSLLQDIPRGHSKVMQEGLRGLARYVEQMRATTGGLA